MPTVRTRRLHPSFSKCNLLWLRQGLLILKRFLQQHIQNTDGKHKSKSPTVKEITTRLASSTCNAMYRKNVFFFFWASNLKYTGPMGHWVQQLNVAACKSKDASLAIIYFAVGDLLSCFQPVFHMADICCRNHLRIRCPLSKPQQVTF